MDKIMLSRLSDLTTHRGQSGASDKPPVMSAVIVMGSTCSSATARVVRLVEKPARRR